MSKTANSNRKSASDLIIMVGTICLPLLAAEVSNLLVLIAVIMLMAFIVYEVCLFSIRFSPIYLVVNFLQWVLVTWASWGINSENLNGILVLAVCVASLMCVINNNLFIANPKP